MVFDDVVRKSLFIENILPISYVAHDEHSALLMGAFETETASRLCKCSAYPQNISNIA
jgi:hypothetical protein